MEINLILNSFRDRVGPSVHGGFGCQTLKCCWFSLSFGRLHPTTEISRLHVKTRSSSRRHVPRDSGLLTPGIGNMHFELSCSYSCDPWNVCLEFLAPSVDSSQSQTICIYIYIYIYPSQTSWNPIFTPGNKRYIARRVFALPFHPKNIPCTQNTKYLISQKSRNRIENSAKWDSFGKSIPPRTHNTYFHLRTFHPEFRIFLWYRYWNRQSSDTSHQGQMAELVMAPG